MTHFLAAFVPVNYGSRGRAVCACGKTSYVMRVQGTGKWMRRHARTGR